MGGDAARATSEEDDPGSGLAPQTGRWVSSANTNLWPRHSPGVKQPACPIYTSEITSLVLGMLFCRCESDSLPDILDYRAQINGFASMRSYVIL